MSKSDENEDQSSKEAVLASDQDSSENIVPADESAGHGVTKDSDEVENSHKSNDTTVNVVNKANTSSSTSRDQKEENKQRILLQKASEELHCPFYWQADIPINAYKSHEIDLLSDSEEMFDQTSFQYRRFIIHLVMCYHTFSKGSLSQSIQLLDNMERMLVRSARRDSDDFLFNTIRTALYHISHSCRVYIHLKTNQIEKAYKTMEKITSYESMDDANKAAIWGIRAAVYAEYCYEGVKTAVTFTEKALELDKKNPFWHFYRGVYLGRLRRMQKGPTGPKVPTDEEIRSLETALRLRQDPAFHAFVAETFTELIKSIKVKNYPPQYQENLTQLLENLSVKAVEYFEQSVAKKENSAHLLFRCGKGLMRLPPPYQNLVKAKHYLEKGLEISPRSPFGNHAMAMFKAECENDSEEAERYLELSKDRKNFQAHLDFCRLRYLKNGSGEFLIAELRMLLEETEEIPKRCRVYAELICCYLFVKYDLVEACKCAKSLLEMQTEWMDYIYAFKSGLFPFSQAVALIDILVAETRLRSLRKNVSEAERNEYTIFFELLLQKKVQLHDISKNIFRKYEEDLKRGLSKKRAQIAKPPHRQKAESRPNDDVRHNRNNHREKSRSPSRERRRSHERRKRDDPSGARADRGAVDEAKYAPRPPTKEISTNEKIEAFIANAQQKGSEIRYSVDEASKNVANKSVRDREDRTDDRESIRSGRDRKNKHASNADQKSVRSNRDAKGRRSASSSPDTESKSRRRKEDKKNRDHSSSSVEEKLHREGERTERESRSERAPKKSGGRRSPSPDHKSVTSSRSYRKDERRHSSSNPDDRRADTRSIRSNRSNRKDLDSASRSGRGTRADRSPCSVASSRRNRRKERDDKSRSSSSSSSSSSRSRSRGSKRRSKRSISRESRRSRRSHRRRSSSVESKHERRRQRHRSQSSDRSKRSGARKDGEKYSRRRKNRDLSTSESGSSSSSRSSSSDRRSRRPDRRRRHRSRSSSSSSSGDRSRQSHRSKGSRAHRSPDERRRHSSRRRSRREGSSDRSGSESSSSGSTVHSRTSKRSEVKK